MLRPQPFVFTFAITAVAAVSLIFETGYIILAVSSFNVGESTKLSPSFTTENVPPALEVISGINELSEKELNFPQLKSS